MSVDKGSNGGGEYAERESEDVQKAKNIVHITLTMRDWSPGPRESNRSNTIGQLDPDGMRCRDRFQSGGSRRHAGRVRRYLLCPMAVGGSSDSSAADSGASRAM